MKGNMNETGNDSSPLQKLKHFFFPPKEEAQQDATEKKSQGKKPKGPLLAVLLVAGVGIMAVSSFTTPTEEQDSSIEAFEETASKDVETFGNGKASASNASIAEYEKYFEDQLKTALEDAMGIDEVQVVVTLESSEMKQYEKNVVEDRQVTNETDREGGKRTVEDSSIDKQVVIIREGDKEIPLLRGTVQPEVRGVLVVAKGAENIQLKKWIIEAVTRSLDVPSHRVAVLPMKGE
ncbi:stage III sporulation protein AG [Bacillus fonticola]|uniref:stage III sporulation protein AG n=1 Tax=Bacillus fonticola TaxID=2728853 RepID=UPI001D147ABA|nr:stage III sporulation protein AG [Bacillus fonticola]